MPQVNSVRRWLVVAMWLLAPGLAQAYPTSVIFAPTGDVRTFGGVTHTGYMSMTVKPHEAPGAWWFCNQFSVLPQIPYGKSGVSFGGFEIGLDWHNGDLFGTQGTYVKPLLNGKIQLFTEYGLLPHLSVGYITAPAHSSRSPEMIYLVATKTLGDSESNIGRLTLGAANFYNQQGTVFYGTKPFFEDKPSAVIAGYESPEFGPFSLLFDHVGGVGEVSSTNVAVVFAPFAGDGGTLLFGGYFGNDRRTEEGRFRGLFAMVIMNWNILRGLRGR
jgi:hypothetical protein